MPPAKSPPAEEVIAIPIPDGELHYWPQAFTADEAVEWLARLRESLDWRQEEIVIFGQSRRVPRLVAWHGDPGAGYTYSGTFHEPQPWTPELETIRRRVQHLCSHPFNSVLANLYRDGRDGMGWHADDEPELGRNPAIASVSFGATRRFRLRHRRNALEPVTLPLASGSLLLMSGALQHHWVHALPKTAVPVGERLNLTFRHIVPGVALLQQ
ncbi:MAG TPA: alpha-ketoglutarate-dependent dioxygenase AlkB [Steroidobacteraceae bacterium]